MIRFLTLLIALAVSLLAGVSTPAAAMTRDPDDSRAKTETTSYDALLALSLEDAAGILREFLYDDQFRLSRIDFSTSPNESLDFGHDLLGRITSIAPVVAPAPGAGDPAVAFHYNALGLLDEETSNGVTTTYGHDLNGRPARTTNSATSRVLTTQHDAAGRVYRVVETHGATRETLFGHDLAGNLVREDMPNDCFQETDFDPLGRVTSRRLRENTGPTLCRADYQYDLLANVTRIEESAAHPDIVSRLVENTYNERNQLVTETTTRSGGTLGSAVDTRDVLHRFDPAENRIASDISTAINGIPAATLLRTFDYGDATDSFSSNQLRTLTETPGGGPPTTTYYTYSDNGNRESRTVGIATDHYTYDSFDRLTGYELNTATSAENGEWQYAYDPLSRRISRSVDDPPTSTRHFAFSSSSPAHEWDDTDVTSHTGGGVGGRLYSRHPSGTYSQPFHNSRGDVMAEFSAAGNLISHTSRDADGLPLDTFGTATGPYGPNGKWQEPGGLVNDGFRHRDLHTATFLSRNPAGFIDGPNQYNYVGHNPWSAFDPHGLATSLQIPTGTADIGYVGDTSVSWHDPPMISYGPNRDSGTAGSQHPYGYSPGGGPGVTVDPVSDAVGSQPSSLLDNALDAYAWVREISRGYSFGYDYLGGVMGAGYPEDTVPPHPGPYREPQPGTFAYFQDKIWDFTLFFAELPGKTVAAAITLGGATDITTGTEITYDLEYGYGMSEVTPGSRWVAGALIAIPFRAGSYVDDGIRIATSKSPSTTLRIGSKLETRTGTEMAEEVANSTPVKYIGRMDDLKGIPRGQTLLDDLPYQGSPRADYYQNSSVLRKALRDGYEIRDASAIRPNWEPAPTPDWPTRTVGQTFTGAERLILDNKGLKLSPSGAYVPK